MKHTMKSVTQSLSKRASKMMHRTPTEAPPLSAVEKIFCAAQAVMDEAARKFHQDATPHLKASTAALAKAEATFRKAYLVHEKKMKE